MEVGVWGVQGEEPHRKKLQQLLEIERKGSKEKVERVEREASRRRKSPEVNNEASKRNLDEGWNREDRYA